MERVMLFPAGRFKAVIMSYDDGLEQDAELLRLLERYHMKCTFNLSAGCFPEAGHVYPPGELHRRLDRLRAAGLFRGKGHEIAVHGLYHEQSSCLDRPQFAYQLMEDRYQLEALFGCLVRGFAYPYGTCTRESAEILSACGFAYGRTAELTHAFDLQEDRLLGMAFTTRHRLEEFLPLARSFAQADPLADRPRPAPLLLSVFGHTYEFERSDNWRVIKQFMQMMGGKEDIWPATCIEYVDYLQDYRRLRASCDGSILHNPSAQRLWFYQDGKVWSIAPGETLLLPGNGRYAHGERCSV